MKKIIIFIFLLILLTNSSLAGTITFGYGKAYDWSSTYWATLTNVRDTNITVATGSDGWKTLAFQTPVTTQDWDNLTGFTIVGTTTEISPAGQLYQVESGLDVTYAAKSAWSVVGNTHSLFYLQKMDSWAISTTMASGSRTQYQDGTSWISPCLISDGTYIDVYGYTAAWEKKTDTTVPADARFHTYGWRRSSGGNCYFSIDGGEIANWALPSYASDNGRLYVETFRRTGDPDPVETHIDWHKLLNTSTPWQTADGILESNAASAVFDAGAGNIWNNLNWSFATPISTEAITVKARTSGTLAGVTLESYFSVTDAVTFEASEQARYIQILINLADAGAGQYTPVLQDLTATWATMIGPHGAIGNSVSGKRK